MASRIKELNETGYAVKRRKNRPLPIAKPASRQIARRRQNRCRHGDQRRAARRRPGGIRDRRRCRFASVSPSLGHEDSELLSSQASTDRDSLPDAYCVTSMRELMTKKAMMGGFAGGYPQRYVPNLGIKRHRARSDCLMSPMD